MWLWLWLWWDLLVVNLKDGGWFLLEDDVKDTRVGPR